MAVKPLVSGENLMGIWAPCHSQKNENFPLSVGILLKAHKVMSPGRGVK